LFLDICYFLLLHQQLGTTIKPLAILKIKKEGAAVACAILAPCSFVGGDAWFGLLLFRRDGPNSPWASKLALMIGAALSCHSLLGLCQTNLTQLRGHTYLIHFLVVFADL